MTSLAIPMVICALTKASLAFFRAPCGDRVLYLIFFPATFLVHVLLNFSIYSLHEAGSVFSIFLNDVLALKGIALALRSEGSFFPRLSINEG